MFYLKLGLKSIGLRPAFALEGLNYVTWNYLEKDLSASWGGKGDQQPHIGPGGPSGKVWGAVRSRCKMVAVAKESNREVRLHYSA